MRIELHRLQLAMIGELQDLGQFKSMTLAHRNSNLADIACKEWYGNGYSILNYTT